MPWVLLFRSCRLQAGALFPEEIKPSSEALRKSNIQEGVEPRRNFPGEGVRRRGLVVLGDFNLYCLHAAAGALQGVGDSRPERRKEGEKGYEFFCLARYAREREIDLDDVWTGFADPQGGGLGQDVGL